MKNGAPHQNKRNLLKLTVRPQSTHTHLHNMSSKLVKKLLQQTSELESDESAKEKSLSKKRKRAVDHNETPVTMDKNELLQRHIQSKIRLDRTLSSRGASRQSVDRVEKERTKQSKLRLKALRLDGGVGNSRGSSYQKTHEHHEPTFNKRRNREEKKKKMLQDIAKLLKKTKNKSTK